MMNLVPALLTSMSKTDIASSEFWASQFSSFTPANVALVLIFALITGIVISLVYRITYRGVLYSPQFSLVLIMLTLVTAPVVMAIGSNVALSMGMVGALSIVRFRTSIKDSRDTTYIFWTIIIGICCGVGDYMVAGAGSAGVFLVLLAFGRVRNENRMLLVVRGDFEREADIRRTVFEYYTRPPVMKAENASGDSVELIYELDRRSVNASARREAARAAAESREQASIIRKLRDLGGVDYVNVVVQSDEIT